MIKQSDGSFFPAFNSDYDEAQKIKIGEAYEFEYKKPRNYKFHKKFFALIDLVYQNQRHYNNSEHLRYDLTIKAGYYNIRYDIEGRQIIEPQSIAFGSMDENEFNKFYSAIIGVVTTYFDICPEDIQEHILQYF